MIIKDLVSLNPASSDRAICHAAWAISGKYYFLVFDYLDITSPLDLFLKNEPLIAVEHFEHPAGHFNLYTISDPSRLTAKFPYLSICTNFPRYNSMLTLHTALDRIDNLSLFRKWLLHYKALGIETISVCINGQSDKSSLAILVHKEAQEIFANVIVYTCPLPWRYSPQFVNPAKIRAFHAARPANFHHVQHVMMHLCTLAIDSEYYLFVDIDEFVQLPQNVDSLESHVKYHKPHFIYWENSWHFYINNNLCNCTTDLVIDMKSDSPFPGRSKYCIRKGAAKYLNIHQPILNEYCGIAHNMGRLVHLYNLSSYSQRPKSISAALCDLHIDRTSIRDLTFYDLFDVPRHT